MTSRPRRKTYPRLNIWDLLLEYIRHEQNSEDCEKELACSPGRTQSLEHPPRPGQLPKGGRSPRGAYARIQVSNANTEPLINVICYRLLGRMG